MNDIQVFNNEQFGEIRTTTINGEPWFVSADVCRALDIKDASKAMERLDDDEGGRIEIAHPQNPEKTLFVNAVNEPGLYSLVLGSRKPEAKEFKRWITHKVIPSIRKHGMYATPATIDNILNDPDFGIRLLTELKEERSKRVELEAKVEANAPKVLFSDSVAASNSCILIGQLAKQLKQNGLDIGQQRLFDRMRKDGYLCGPGNRKNLPTQRAMEMGLFQIKERTHTNPDGSVVISRTTLVTGKGQIYFTNKYLINRI